MSGINHLGLRGIDFVEFVSPEPEALHKLFLEFGFSRVAKHKTKNIDYYKQNDIHFFINKETGSFGDKFKNLHGPSICSMGWRMDDGAKALEISTQRGAKAGSGDFQLGDKEIPAIYGIAIH